MSDDSVMTSGQSLPAMTTLNDLVFKIARRDAPEVLRYKRAGAWVSISAREAYSTVVRMSAALKRLGLRKGDRVAVWSENRPEWTLADLAVLACGAATVPLYPTLTAAACEYMLRDSGSRVIFLSRPEHLEKMHGCWARLPELERAVLFGGQAPAGMSAARVLRWEELVGWGHIDPVSEEAKEYETSARAVGPDDLASIVYTSGTTGEPRGVLLTHDNIVSNVLAVPLEFIGPSDVALSFLPLSHIYERMVFYTFLHHGIPVAYAESNEAVPQNLLEVRPTLATAVPRFFEKLHSRIMGNLHQGSWPRRKLFWWAASVGRQELACRVAGRPAPGGLRLRHRLADRLVFRRLRRRLGGRLRCFLSGGGPLSPQLAEFFTAVNVMVCEGYGLTETSPVVTCNVPSRPRPGTTGRPLEGVEVRIAADGEILVRGRNVMKGYHNRPEETAQAIVDGWLHTGDIGELTAEGDLRVTDRKKDLLKTAAGKLVAPQPIENLLRSLPYISNAVVVGDRRRHIAALLVPDFQRLSEFACASGLDGASPAALIRHPLVRNLIERQVDQINAGLAPFEQIKRFALLADDFSIAAGNLTPTFKVRRRIVEEEYSEIVAELYK